MPRGFNYLTLTSFKRCLLISLTLAVIRLGEPWLYKTGNLQYFISAKDHSVVRIAVINSVFYHSEVWYSYIYAAGIRARFHVSLFTDVLPHSIQNENGFSYITQSWSRSFPYGMQEHANQLLHSISKMCSYQIIIMATLEVAHLKRLLNALVNHCNQNATYLLLVQIHEGALDLPLLEKCLSEFPRLLSQKRVAVRLLALAHHVKKYAERYMKVPLPLDIWMPVFPLDLPVDAENDEHHGYFDFVIQGHLNSHRRNYSGFLDEVRRHIKVLEKHRITFTIVGRSVDHEDYRRFRLPQIRLFIAPQLMPANIYYNIIHQSAGIIPLFARDSYYNGTQSSSISTSFITRTPLLASQRLLETHPHVPSEVVWFKHKNETDIGAIVRIVSSYPSSAAFRKALFRKRQHLGQMVESFYAENTRILQNYARSVTRKV